MGDLRAPLTRLIPKALRGVAFASARQIRVQIFGIPEPFHDLRRLRDLLRPDVVLDVGAHVGETARQLSHVFPGIELHCFEPTPDSFDQLRNNAADLGPAVRLHNVALGDTDGEATFFHNLNAQTNSLLDNDVDGDGALAQAMAHQRIGSVSVRRMDTWFAESRLPSSSRMVVKCDIQGAERLLIAGAGDLLANNVVAFYTEVSLANLYQGQTSLEELLATMNGRGFTLYQLYRTRSNASGRALWLDAMWYNPQLAPIP